MATQGEQGLLSSRRVDRCVSTYVPIESFAGLQVLGQPLAPLYAHPCLLHGHIHIERKRERERGTGSDSAVVGPGR